MTASNDSVTTAGGAPGSQSQQQQPRRVVFHLTGFGVFNGIPDNPTTHLMRELPLELGACSHPRKEGGTLRDEARENRGPPWSGVNFEVRTCEVLEVSAYGGGRRLLELFSRACGEGEEGEDADSGLGAALATTIVFVHCGVNGGAKEFALEVQGFNEATFEAPDELGYCPSVAPVDENNPDTSHCRVTTVPVARVLERLRGLGWGKELVRESNDAGRFVCNYVYYTSLGLCEGTIGDLPESGELHSLFIHVPPFAAIPKERQLAFLVDCLSATAAALGAVPPVTTDVPARKKASAPDFYPRDASQLAGSYRPGARTSPPPTSSIWHSAPSPEASPSSIRSDGRPRGRNDRSCAPFAEGDGMDGVRQNSLHALSDDDVEGGLHTVSRVTRQRLIDAGYDDLDVDAAMATTGSDSLKVNMQFLLDMAALLPPGAPTDRDGLYLQEFCNDAGSGGGGAPPARVLKSRTKAAISPSGMRGVSPKWARDMSHIDPMKKNGEASEVGLSPITGVVRRGNVSVGDSSSNNSGGNGGNGSSGADHSRDESVRSKAGGLLSRIRRRHKRGSSTASDTLTTEDGASRDLPLMSRWRSSPAKTDGMSPKNEYCRQTTGRTSISPTSPYASSGFGRRSDSSTAWGESESSRKMTGKSSNSPIVPHPGSGFGRRSNLSTGWGEVVPAGLNLRLVLLVRLDLAMGPGGVASQCCKAALAVARKAETNGRGDTLAVWREAGEAMVVLGVADVGTLDAVLAMGAASHLAITMIQEKDAPWIGNVSTETCTVAAIGPAPMTSIRAVVSGLPVL